MKAYYVPFYPAERIDYLVLLSLYDIAEFNGTTRVFDTIHYQSVKSLAELLCVSEYAVNTLLSGGKYSKYLSADKANKVITLHNCFSRNTKPCVPFVVLTDADVRLMRKQQDNLFC